jgi:hypothetical protein
VATIKLYADKINQMPGLIKDVKKSVIDYKAELAALQKKSLSIRKDICNMDDVISSLRTSSQTQERKIASLDEINKKFEDFVADVVRIDNEVADLINQRKNEFFDKYTHLRPDCERSDWDKFCDGLKSVGEWCKDNWKSIGKILAAAVIIAAIGIASVLTGGILGVVLVGAFWGALSGALIGGTAGGITAAINGGSFLDGFADGALSGAVIGGITGAAFSGIGVLGSVFGSMIKCSTKLANVVTLTSRTTKVLSIGMDGFDMLTMGAGLFDPSSAWVKANQKLHSSTLYNGLQIGANALAILTGGAKSTMKCFVAGTMISTATGLVAIENIKAGDKVTSTNTDTFETAEKTVLETYVRETTELVHLTVNGELIKTTFDHPFYVKDKGFVNAGELRVGNEVINANDETYLIEHISLEIVDEPVTVYNFQVDDFQTYHVGNSSVLVHNASMEYEIPTTGRTIKMKDVDIDENYEYTKKDRSLLGQERKTFNSKSQDGVKAKFLKEEIAPLGKDFLKSKGLSDADIFDINNGVTPNGYHLHHKYPLDDGGGNSSDNLILIKQQGISSHQNFTDYQNSITHGLKPGETRVLDWPVPTGKVY